MSSAGSAEHSTLVATSNVMITALSADPLALARKLFANGWIPQGVLSSVRIASKTNEEKATELVELIISKVGDFPEKFELFLKIVGEDPCLKDLVKLIRRKHGENIQSLKMEAMPKPERPADNDSDRGPPEDDVDSGVPTNGAATETPQYNEKKQEEELLDNMPEPGKAEYADQLKIFRSEVEIILHTANDNEYIAAITFMKPPMEPLKRPVQYQHIKSGIMVFLGIFAEKKTVLIQTLQGAECRVEMKEVLKAYPAAQYVLAVGVCYGFNRKKVELGDVLVSQKISDFSNSAEKGKILDRGNRRPVKQFLLDNFCKRLFHVPSFEVTTDKRPSKVHSGLIISRPILIDDKETRDKVLAAEPEAIGGEMEGGIVMQLLIEEKYTEKGVIVIKGVADFADGHKDKAWQYTAAKAAFHYTWSKLKNAPPEVSAED